MVWRLFFSGLFILKQRNKMYLISGRAGDLVFGNLTGNIYICPNNTFGCFIFIPWILCFSV